MAIIDTRIPRVKPSKVIEFNWEDFRRGLNTLLSDTEINKDELAKADNLILTGKGVPTIRWGTSKYYDSAATGAVRGLKSFKQSDGTLQLLAVTDQGFLTKKSGATYSTLTGASWASGFPVEMAQIDDKMYLVSESRELVRYSNPTLVGFPTISQPSSVFATQFSGASGAFTYSYRVSTKSKVGETLASSSVLTDNNPQDLVDGAVLVTWTAPSAASGDVTGFNIYGRNESDERFLSSVDSQATEYLDDGSSIPLEFTFPPSSDSTGGVKAKYIKRFQDRLVYAGIDNDPTKVVITGRVPLQERTDIASGGNFIRIEPDAGDNVTGITTFQDKIIVFKEKSTWQITLSQQQIGNFFVTIPSAQLINASVGCIANRTIKAVENDVFFLSRRGVYALGNEPNVFNVLRTNEISARVRPYFDDLTTAQKENSSAFYKDFKYGVSSPGKEKTIVYDRERLAWMGPWTKDANVYEFYVDSLGDDHLLYGEDDSPQVQEYKSTFKNDNGSSIVTELNTKKEDYGDWTIFKTVKEVFALFRNIEGTVNVDIKTQDRDGDIRTAKSFSITSTSVNSSGWGSDLWADSKWGDSEQDATTSDVNETYRWTTLNKASRNVQVVIKTSQTNSNYELLSLRSRAKPIGFGFLPASERV